MSQPRRATSRKTRRSPTAAGSTSQAGTFRLDPGPDGRSQQITAAGTCGSRKVGSRTHLSTSGPTMRSRSSPARHARRLESRFRDLRRLGQGGRREDLHQRPAAADQVTADDLKQTIRTKIPFKIGQRHTSSRVRAAGRSHVCAFYARALCRARSDNRWRCSSAPHSLQMPADKRPAAEQDGVFAWWRSVLDPDSSGPDGPGSRPSRPKKRAIKMRGTSPT